MLKLQPSSDVPWAWSVETRIGKEKETIKKKERKRGQEKKERRSSTTNVRTHRAGSSQQSGSSSRSPGFRDESILFSKYSPNFLFTGMCLLYPNPPLTTPRIRVRGKKPSPKMFFLHFLHRGKKTIFLTTIESNSSINNLGENRLRVIRFFS